MPSRYELRFSELRKDKRKAFISFTILGWPDKERSLSIIKQMVKSGVSALELGIAFSDPIADGPILQAAAFETISSGFSLDNAFDLLAEVRALDTNIPIGLLVYFNTVLAKGVENFYALAKRSGADAVLVADLPAENASEVVPMALKIGIDPIFLISPVTPADRLNKIISQASGFLYLISRLGVTGTEARSQQKDLALKNRIDEIRARTNLPICAGFGISSPADAQSMFAVGADGVITGSQVIKIMQSDDFAKASQNLEKYFTEMLTICNQEQSINNKLTAIS
jgi:tryptophan synthase alpha chain